MSPMGDEYAFDRSPERPLTTLLRPLREKLESPLRAEGGPNIVDQEVPEEKSPSNFPTSQLGNGVCHSKNLADKKFAKSRGRMWKGRREPVFTPPFSSHSDGITFPQGRAQATFPPGRGADGVGLSPPSEKACRSLTSPPSPAHDNPASPAQ